MYDFVLFGVLLILIATSVALVFLILFGDSSKKNSCENQKNINQLSAEDEYNEIQITKNDIELMEKFRHTFSDDEINRFKEIDNKISKISKKSNKM